jgi:hypothetical protein
MEDKEQKIKISYETNADETAKQIEGVNKTLDNTAKETEKVENSQKSASSSTKELGKNIAELDIPINATIGGFKAMLKQMWLIVANPIGAILAAIVLVFVGLVAIFKTFTPLVDKLEQAMAALGAVFNVVKNAFISVFTGTKSLSEAFSGMGDEMADAAKRTMDLVKAQQDLEDVLKSQEVTTAKNRAAINKLNVELRNRIKTEEERLKIADEIVKKENEDFQQRKKLVDQEVRLAREAIAIKAQFTKEEMKLLKETGDATKELAESRGGNYDEEYDALNKARLKAIALEDEVTTNIEKAYNRRDKLEDEQQAKAEKAAADAKARADKARAEAEKREAERLALLKQGTDAEKALQRSIEDLEDDTEEKKLERQKQRAIEEIEALKQKGVDVENITKLNDEKFMILEAELFEKRSQEREERQKIEDEKAAEEKRKADEKALEEQKRVDDAKLRLAEQLEKSKADIANKALNLFSILAGKNKKLQKAAIIAEGAVGLARTFRSTAEGNAAALAQGIVQAGPVAGPKIAFPAIAANTINGVLSGATIIAQTGLALKALGGGGGGLSNSSAGGGGSTPTSAAPQVDFQASSENQIANATASNLSNQPIEAFIVESSVSSAQQLANNRITSNSL